MQKLLVGTSLLPEILGQSYRVGAKSPIFDLFSFVAPQLYDLANKVQLTLIGSSLRAFQRCPCPQKGLSQKRSVQNLKN